jgi:hypothetical protein
MSLHVNINTFSGLAHKIKNGIFYLTRTVYGKIEILFIHIQVVNTYTYEYIKLCCYWKATYAYDLNVINVRCAVFT